MNKRFKVTTSVDGFRVSETPMSDPFMRHITRMGWRSLVKLLWRSIRMRRDIDIEVMVTADRPMTRSVMNVIAGAVPLVPPTHDVRSRHD